ncbi:MaoC/PaaZ C-terminal domain-containing protein [Butyrivibrio sp. AC2005]|uniref:MaoC/PaaZ C-terminal domain-containing protein n=1 Tax=Butyrivibrio sp. AC2005 TaxID=1280672 RepID=UPI000416BEBA|nr:MaoC/PaaZ C-terminal domain-containing protein [Butyrivibrio sp. AC2005]
MNEYKLDQIEIGLEASFRKTVTTDMENAFREISGDDNPLHRDDEFTLAIGDGKFRKHVTFGMLTASLYSTVAGMYLPGKYSLIHSIDELSFLRPVYIGDELEVTGKVIDKREELKLIVLKVVICNQFKEVVSRAKMKVIVLK